jgi:hypothetical protein
VPAYALPGLAYHGYRRRNVNTVEPQKYEKGCTRIIKTLVPYPVLLETTIIIYHNSDLITLF